jgi:pyrroloquinoline quinone (PQQ) biosynthesis protein C
MEGVMPSPIDEKPAYRSVEPILDAIANWVKKYRYAAGLRDELARCRPEEVAQTAHELGLSSRELYRLASKGPHAADLLKKMLLALGVNPKTLASQDPLLMRDLQRLCISCDHKKQCKHELAAGTAAKHYRNFCPNAFTLDAIFDAK